MRLIREARPFKGLASLAFYYLLKRGNVNPEPAISIKYAHYTVHRQMRTEVLDSLERGSRESGKGIVGNFAIDYSLRLPAYPA